MVLYIIHLRVYSFRFMFSKFVLYFSLDTSLNQLCFVFCIVLFVSRFLHKSRSVHDLTDVQAQI